MLDAIGAIDAPAHQHHDPRPGRLTLIVDHPKVVTPVAGSVCDGVRVYAERSAAARSLTGRPTDVRDVADRSAVDADVLHLHLTDRWWLSHGEHYHWWLQWARRTGATVVMTVHDVPDPAEGSERFERRCGLYRAMTSKADLVVVSSEHERAGAAALGIDAAVVFHPAFAPRPDPTLRQAPRVTGRIGVLGYVHPGKGYLDLMETLGAEPPSRRFELRLIGAAPTQHHDHLQCLQRRASELGVVLSVTGSVTARRWSCEIAATAVPVAVHRHVSASGSVLDWIAHGRRPLVGRNGFTTELASRAPGVVTVVDADWSSALERALDDASSTELAELPAALRPDVAVDVFESILRG
jgi:hypothetical protein